MSEALEDWRVGAMETTFNENGKPAGFAIELADVLIRVADLAGRLNLNLEEAVAAKLAYNKNCPYRHGGKRA